MRLGNGSWTLAVAFATGLAAAQTPTKDGPEFMVNTFTTGLQTPGAVAMAPDGRFVVAWSHYPGSGGFDYNVMTQLFAADGTKVGDEFQVNTYTNGDQQPTEIAWTSDGGFVVTWYSFGQDGQGGSTHGQKFDASGTPMGGEFQANTHTPGNQGDGAIAADANGNFVVVWASRPITGTGQDGDGGGIFARLYDSSGNPYGPEFVVNGYTTGDQAQPTVAMDPAGGFVVAWSDYTRGSDGEVFARRFDSSGAPLGLDFQVNSSTTSYQFHPTLGMDSNGNFVVAWQSNYQDGDYAGIFAQRFDATGSPVGTEFQINAYTTGGQFVPRINVAPNGSFVVVWHTQTGDQDEIFGRRFSSDGQPLSEEFQANTYTTGGHSAHSISGDADGNFVVVFDRPEFSYLRNDVFGQRFAVASGGTPPSVTVTSPNGKEKVFAGSPYVVRWTASDDSGIESFDVLLSTNAGSSYDGTPICDAVPGTETSCVWNAPGPLSTRARIKVVAHDDAGNTGEDASDANFKIVGGVPKVKVTSPSDPGLAWRVGSKLEVAFNHNLGLGAPVTIDLNRDYPAGSWETLTTTHRTLGTTASSFLWTVTGPLTTNARVQVRGTDVPAAQDIGNAAFSIISRVTVVKPNTALTLKVTSNSLIKWTHNLGKGSTFQIAIDRDGDLACEQVLAASVSSIKGGSATYNWLVSGPPGPARICVSSTANSTDADISDSAFQIVQ